MLNENTSMDPLDVPLDDVKTGFPLIKAESILDFTISEVNCKSNAARTLSITLKTNDPCQSQENETLEPGQKVFANINTQATGRAEPRMVQGFVAEFYQSTGLKGWSLRDVVTRNQELVGLTVRARVGIQPAGPDRNGTHRQARNTITAWVKK